MQDITGLGRDRCSRHPVRLRVNFKESVERGYVRAPRNRHGHTIRSARTQPDQAARPDEEVQDVRRVIGERIGRMIAPGNQAPVSAAVGVDAPANKFDRMLLHDVVLPGFEDDRPQMLSSGTVLRKQ